MLSVLSITSPIFLLIAIGYLSVRTQWLQPSHAQALGAFVLRLAMPALIFKSLSSRSIGEIDARYLAAYAGASLISFGVVFALFARGAAPRAAMRALGAAAPNSGFVGFPAATLFVGPKAALALALCLIVENIVTLPLGLALAERGGQTPLVVVGRLARNPLLIAIALGVAASLSGLALPAPLARGLDLLAAGAPAAALIAIGGGLVGLDLAAGAKEIAPVAAAKLLLHPLLLLAGFALLPGLDPDVRRAMLLMASSPAFSIYPLICRAYGEEKAGSAILLTQTALAFFTMSLWAAVF